VQPRQQLDAAACREAVQKRRRQHHLPGAGAEVVKDSACLVYVVWYGAEEDEDGVRKESHHVVMYM